MAVDILVVDDEHDICQLIGETLEDEGYRVRTAHDGPSAIEEARRRCPDLVVLDIWLGDSRFDGIRVLEMILQLHPGVPVIMMSGHGTIETAVETIRKGAYDFVEKPFKMDRLLVAIKRAQEASSLRQENEELRNRSDFDQEDFRESVIPGTLQTTIKRLASSQGRLMLSGEAGSGKNYIARMIHGLSNRSRGRFVRVNCSLITESTFEKEIFGAESEDSITVGALENAHNGTLFLDQVDCLDKHCQKILLKALQEKSFKRVAGKSSITFDVRLISSVTSHIEESAKADLFLKDLLFHLCVTLLKVPSLKERLDEMAMLVEAFSRLSAKNHSSPLKTFSKDSWIALKAYSWPGNLKQLKNVIDWLYVMKKTETHITPEHLPVEITNEMPSLSINTDQMTHLISLPLKEARTEFERDYLKAQVTRFSGNISSTANFVGMERSALHRKLKSLKISRAS